MLRESLVFCSSWIVYIINVIFFFCLLVHALILLPVQVKLFIYVSVLICWFDPEISKRMFCHKTITFRLMWLCLLCVCWFVSVFGLICDDKVVWYIFFSIYFGVSFSCSPAKNINYSAWKLTISRLRKEK